MSGSSAERPGYRQRFGNVLAADRGCVFVQIASDRAVVVRPIEWRPQLATLWHDERTAVREFLVQTTGVEAPPTVQTWLATQRGEGGVFDVIGGAPIYVLRWLLADVARVSCLFGDRKVVDMSAKDHAVVLLKFANGIAAEMTCTFGIAHGPLDHSITMHRRDGFLELSHQRLHVISPRLYGDTQVHEIPLAETDSTFGFAQMWADYARAILTGVPTRQTGEDGKRAVEIVQAAYRSNATGRTVELPLRVD